MTLAELLGNLEKLDDDLTIYASASPTWHPKSDAAALTNTDETTNPVVVNGVPMEYLLEVFIAKEVVEGWQEWRREKALSAEEICETVIFYALHDAYPPESSGEDS